VTPGAREAIEDFAAFGVRAFTTTRGAGSFSTSGAEPVGEVMERWHALRRELAAAGPRFASAAQVHGTRVAVHGTGWEGWLRLEGTDGHAAIERGTGMAVTIADCVPIFLAHPSGAAALLHSGWRGTAGRIVERGIEVLRRNAVPTRELHVHLGPAICGGCYEVSPDVYSALTGRSVDRPTTVDLRALIAEHAHAAGVRNLVVSDWCTRCHSDRFFSHRAGDAGRQLAVLIGAAD
jgi:purine-nucleoside/S-methyl-5'-thioadenosine phosphorylase / adenosine deaminase